MTDQLSPAIAVLIAAGRARLDQQRADLKAKKDAEAAQRRTQIDEQIAGLHSTVMALLPEALQPYCGLVCDDSEPLNGWQYARLKVPGCSPITITVEVNGYWDNQHGEYVRATNYTPVKHDTHPLFRVERYQLAFDDEEGLYSVIEHTEQPNDTHYGSDDIDVALELAAEWWTKRADLETQANIKTTEVQARRAAQQAQASVVTERATAEREALLNLLSDDPVAIHLLKAFVALKRERAGYVEAIDTLRDTLDSQSEHHARQLAEKQHDAVLAVRNARTETERTQREADDRQAKLTRVKRDAQYT